MIVSTPTATCIRDDPEPRCAGGGVPPAQPQVDVAPKKGPSQNRRNRCGDRLDDLLQQDLKHKGMFHLVNPNETYPFGNRSDANPIFFREENPKGILMGLGLRKG